MAERRMFTKKITDDDHFMSLSSSAQALYLHLSMNADDDGFCNQVNTSMFKAHASVQDLQALLENRYIYQFDSGVIVIKHWRMANALRKDRYTPTAFQKELAQLELKDNGSYTFGNQLATTWQPDGNQLATQDRLDKDSLVKDNNILPEKSVKDDLLEERFETFWGAYPKKTGRKVALKSFKKIKPDEELLAKMLSSIEKAKQSDQWKRDNGQYIPYPATWLNQERWEDEVAVQEDSWSKNY